MVSTRPITRFAAAVALAGTVGISGGAAVSAQEATPIGPGACIAPAMVAQVATPIDGSSLATPVEEDASEGTVVEDEAVIAEATAAIENINACFNEGNGEAFVALFTEQGRTAAFGPTDPTDLASYMREMATMAQVSDLEVHEVVENGDGSLDVDYQIMIGKEVLHVTDTVISQNDAWLVDDRTVELPETTLDSTTASVKASVDEGAVTIEVSPNPIMNQPAVKLQVVNNADSPMDLILVQGGDAASVTSTDLSQLPEGVSYIGDAHAEPGEFVDTLFEELEEGAYVVVVETANGESGSIDLTIDPPFDPNA